MLKLLPKTDLLVEQYSDDPPRIIALHGWARNKDDWHSTLTGLPAIAIDLPGFGSANAPEHPWGTKEYARHLLPAVEAVESPILLGHSFGGRIAAQLTAMMPSRVSHLVLTGAPLLPSQSSKARRPPIKYRLIKRLHKHNIVNGRRIEKARMRYGSPDYKAAAGVLRAILVRTVNEDYSSVLHSIMEAHIPVHLVWGAEDNEVPISVAKQLLLRVPNSTLAVVPGAAHALNNELTSTIRTTLEDLLPSA